MNNFRVMLIAVISCILAFSIDVQADDFVDGVVKFELRDGRGSMIQAVIQKNKLAPHPHYEDAVLWGVTDEAKPDYLVTAITVRVGGEKIEVPFSAYADLSNPNSAKLNITRDGFLITINGGDAAGSYNVILTFVGTKLDKRKVTHGEFPEQVWEETVYRSNFDPNM